MDRGKLNKYQTHHISAQFLMKLDAFLIKNKYDKESYNYRR